MIVFITFLLIIEATKKNLILEKVLCIYYSIWFKKDEIQALIDLGSKINAITPIYTSRLDLKTRHIDVGAKKIDSSILETFGMVLVSF